MGLGGGMTLLAGKLQLSRMPPSSSSSLSSNCCQLQQLNQQADFSLSRRHGGGGACPSVRAQRKVAPLLAVGDDDVVITSVRELADGSFHYAFGAGASPPPPQPSKRVDDLASSRAQHGLNPAPVHLPQRLPSRFRKHSPIPARAGRGKGKGKEKQEQEQVRVQQQEKVDKQEVRRVVWRKDPGVPVRPKSAFVKRSPIPNLTPWPRCPVSLPEPVVVDDDVEEQLNASLPILPPPAPSPPPPLLVVNGVAREHNSDTRVLKAAEASRKGASNKAEAASKSGMGASAPAIAESPIIAAQFPAADHPPAPDAAVAIPDAAGAAPSSSRPASKFVRQSPIRSQARKKSLQDPAAQEWSLVEITAVERNVVESKVVERADLGSTVAEGTVEKSREQSTLETAGVGEPVQGLVREDTNHGSSSSKGGSSSAKGIRGGSSGSNTGSSSRTKDSSNSSKGNKSRSGRKSNVEPAKTEEVVEPSPLPPVRPKSAFFRRSPIPRRLPAKTPVQEVKLEEVQPPTAPARARRSPKKSAKEAARNSDPKEAVEERKAAVNQEPETGALEVQDSRAAKPGDQLHADLSVYTLLQLRGFAKSRGLKGYSKLKKAELMALLQQ